MSINYGQISNACNDFCLVPNQKEKTGSTLRTKIKEDWITMLTFFCFLLLLPNPSLHPIQPQAPPTRRPTPSQPSEPPPPGAFLPTFLASLIAPFLAASCAPPYLHINGTVPLDLCSYQSVGTLKERIPPKSLFHEKVVWESCCSWWEWSLATRERSISPAYFQTFQTFSSPLPPPPLCSKMRIVRNNPKKRVVTSKILTLPKLAWPPNP